LIFSRNKNSKKDLLYFSLFRVRLKAMLLGAHKKAGKMIFQPLSVDFKMFLAE